MEPSTLNKSSSSSSHTDFILFGFPGVTRYRPLLIVPFSAIYTVMISANSAVMTIIVLEKSLHSPMYILISSLLAVNVIYTTAITPKMILALVGLDQISLPGCLMQIFTVYTSLVFETVILLLMAVDRYLAISQPLQYWQIITTQLQIHFMVNALLRMCSVVVPLLSLVATLQYCRSNVIYHFHCEATMLFNLGCGDITKRKLVALVIRTAISLCDIGFILLSYLKVLHTVMKIAVGTARHKALHTCSTHLLVVTFMYTLGLLSVILNLSESSSYDVQNASSTIFFLLPTLLNPFIYGLRVKEIKEAFMKHWRCKESGSAPKGCSQTNVMTGSINAHTCN
ncbi:olfactory receptor 56B34-like [Ranitomeya variabilis]|uniref:olfactory receptor 56B34-like n=1 Tax=Ranitomeya variabilis TaxID=490064 RepID=UPI0040568AC9